MNLAVTSPRRLRVLHVISSLADGGAEAVLYRVLTADPGNDHTVVSLTDRGRYGPLLEQAGIAVEAVGMRRGRVTVGGWRRLMHLVRAARPDVVQTWMYHADLLGGLAARMTGVRAVVWGVHSVDVDPLTTRIVVATCAVASRIVPRRIVICSHEGARRHLARGYARDRVTVIPNGYDTQALRPDEAACARLRSEWRLPPGAFAVGMVARWDPVKGHANLIAALACVAGAGSPDWCLILVGQGIDDANVELTARLDQAGIRARTRLLGARTDIAQVMGALDLHVLASRTEAFPNVVAEAMSCGTPCVVTDVGDAAFIVGDTGWVVPPQDPEALAAGLQTALTQLATADGWKLRQNAARARIVAEFSLPHIAGLYAGQWRKAAGDQVPAAPGGATDHR